MVWPLSITCTAIPFFQSPLLIVACLCFEIRFFKVMPVSPIYHTYFFTITALDLVHPPGEYKCPSAVLIVTDLLPVQRCPPPYVAEIFIISTSHILVTLAPLVLFLVSVWSSALLHFNGTLDRTTINTHYKIQLYIDLRCMHEGIRYWCCMWVSVCLLQHYLLHIQFMCLLLGFLMVFSRYELRGFHCGICWPPQPSLLLDELSIDERDSNCFVSRSLVCRSSDSSYNSTDSSLVTVGYQLHFLALLCADLACTWYYHAISCNRY